MPIDPSIALGVRPVQLANPLEQFGQFQQVQAAMNQNRLADLAYGQQQRELGADNALSKLLSAGKAGGDVVAGLASAGYGSKALAYGKQLKDQEKTDADIGKTKAETTAKQVEAATKRLDAAGQAFGFVRANPTLENANAALDYLGQMGVYTPEQVAEHKAKVSANPAMVGQMADMAFRASLDAKDQLAKYDTRNTGSTTDTLAIDPVTGQVKVVSSLKNTVSLDARLQADTSRANNTSTNFTTQRGQNMTDARAREQLAQGKVPAGYRQGPDGTLLAIPGGPADPSNKPPTEFQGKSAAFGARAEQADKILGELRAAGATGLGLVAPDRPGTIKGAAEWVPLIGGGLGTLVNSLPSALGGPNSNQQRAEQAQRDFVNAVLRQESGAAIGASEFDNARKQYFPQPGDSTEVIQQKAANRKLAIRGLQNNAGRAAFSAPPSAAPAQPAVKFLGFE